MRGLSLLLGVLLLFALLFLDLHLKPTTVIFSNEGLVTASAPPAAKREFSLLIGILTRADLYDRRHFLRFVYGTQASSVATIHVKFVLCRLTKAEQRMLIALEILRFEDIIVLNCTENMNAGKTYTYFSSLPTVLPHRYDYMMKADDDAFIRLAALAAALRPLHRSDLDYCAAVPCSSRDPSVGYMSGMEFVLSWDLVQWIATLEIPARDTNRVAWKPAAMYDYPGTVMVHRLKR
ncbi:unnamed protein product [Musa acuminata var. zebrina]